MNLEDTLATQPDRSLSKSANLTVEDAVRRDSSSAAHSCIILDIVVSLQTNAVRTLNLLHCIVLP